MTMQAAEERGLVPLTQSGRAMTLAEYKEREALIAYVVSQMKLDVHYGQIPGTHGRTLYEAGAEHMRAAFNVNWTYEVQERIEDEAGGYVKCRVKGSHIIGLTADGPIKGSSWEATASSRESKFAGFSYSELLNVVPDRAIKRCFVNLIKNVTGASGLFKEAAVDAADHVKDTGPAQWLTHCPIHGLPWRDAKDPKFSPSHRVKEVADAKSKEAWCNQWPVLNGLIKERAEKAAATLGWDVKSTADWMTMHAGGTKWGDVKVPERVKALMALEAEADEAEADEAESLKAQRATQEGPVTTAAQAGTGA